MKASEASLRAGQHYHHHGGALSFAMDLNLTFVQVDAVLRRVDVALHIGPWEVEDMPQ